MEIENSPNQSWEFTMLGARIGKDDVIYVWQKKFTFELESPYIFLTARAFYCIPNASPVS